MSETKRIVLIACGLLCVGLAGAGIFLPVLPTTPLLLLAAVCFARSSQRFHHWLLTNRLFGSYIRNYREGRGIALAHKVVALVLLWTTIGYSAGFVVSLWWVKVLLVGIAVGVTLHLLRAKTYRPQDHALLAAEHHRSEEPL
jgi:hypothetical protein